MPTDTRGWSPRHGQQDRGRGSREGAIWPGSFCTLSEDSRAPGTCVGTGTRAEGREAGGGGGKGEGGAEELLRLFFLLILIGC